MHCSTNHTSEMQKQKRQNMNTSSSEVVSEPVSYGPNTGSPPECAPEFIRRRAYQIFECRGGQSGHELDDWLQAEREIKIQLGLMKQ